MMMGKQVRETRQNSPQTTKSGQFDPRPFASPEPEHETLGREARFGYSFGEIGLLPIQPKLVVGPPDDKYEREADQVAEQVMRMPEGNVLQLKFAECGEDGKKVFKAKEAPGQLPLTQDQDVSPIVHDVLHSPGQPLDLVTRSFFEPRFGQDFSRVRVHTNAKAAESAQAMNARAYTVGREIVFSAGRYSPGTNKGKRLMAHELTHALQQGAMNHQTIDEKLEIDNQGIEGERRVGWFTNQAILNKCEISSNINQAQMSLQRACGRSEIGTVTDCAGQSGDVVGERFLFLVNCDTFNPPSEEDRLKYFASTLQYDDYIEIHGFASIDGPPDFNESLSCARAHKAESVLIGEGISPAQIRPLVMHGGTEGNKTEQRSVIIVKESPVYPAPSSFSHSRAAAYARTWARSTNPTYGRFRNDCTNFVSQAMLAGGWSMVFGTDICAERRNDNVWWFRRGACPRWIRSDVNASHTWGGAENFSRFISTSGRGARANNVMDLEEGDVLQMQLPGQSYIGHSMIVTGKSSTDLFLSYHTSDHLDESLSNIQRGNPGAVYVPWRIQ